MARWRAWRPAPAPLALEVAPVALEADPVGARDYWGTLAMDLLRDTEVPTATVLDAYLSRVLA